MKLSSAPQNATERHSGPNLLVLTILYVAFLAIGGSTLSAAFHIPHDSAETTVAYMAKHGWSIQLGSFCELVTLLNFTAGYFIPVGRFIGILWMIGVAITLPSSLTHSGGAVETNLEA